MPPRSGIEKRPWVWSNGVMSDEDEARAAADKLILAASHAASPHKTAELARRALAVWPHCADAFNLLGELAGDPVEAADLYRQGIEASRREVGPELFAEAEAEGRFGSRRETRPYLRALDGLAGAMMQLDLTREAATLWRELLRLDHADTMAVREYLAVALLALEELDELEGLLEQLREGTTAIPAYCRALFAFRRGRDDADPLLQEAIARNRHTPSYLLGQKPLPEEGPSYVSPGAESEAQAGAGLLITAWRRSEGALDWLADQVRQSPPVRRRRTVSEEEVRLPSCYEGLPRLWGQRARTAVLLDEVLAERGLEVRVRARAARIWAHYASEQRPTIRNPGAPAAAVDYLLGKAFDLHDETRAQLAGRYGVSVKTVSSRAATIEDWLRASPLGPELAPEWFEDDDAGAAEGGPVSVAKVIPFPGPR